MMLGTAVQPALRQASQKVFEAFGRDVHFTGCGIGLRQRDGRRTDEPVVIAMVTKKLPAGAVSRSRLLPRTVEIDGRRWGVDVAEVGPLAPATARGDDEARPDVGGPITGTFRPPLQGCSVSDVSGSIYDLGTFGCLVRDTSDGTICVLGSSFVLAQSGRAPGSEAVIQPGSYFGGTSADEIAKLKRYVPVASGPNYVDAAIAQLTSQTGYSQGVAKDLMKPISAAHPAVGTCVASDQLGLNCFLSLMDRTVTGLGVELLPAKPGSPCIVSPQVGMHIEKVGAGSGYTSGEVVALAAQVNIYDSNLGRTLVYEDMIWSQGLFFGGDSGAVACQGGNGRTPVPLPKPCPVLSSVGHYFHLPLTQDNALSTQLRNEFLAQSMVGNLIIGLVYDNAQTVISRVKGKQATGIEQAYAAGFYQKYLQLVKNALAHPGSTTNVVTQGNLNDFEFILSGLAGGQPGVPAILKPAETTALQTIYNEVLVHTKGKDFDQMIAYMNEPAVFEKVVGALKKVPTISLYGTISDDHV